MTKEPWGQWLLYRGQMWGRPLSVIRCGPGKVAAAAATQAAIQYLDPVVLVSFGAGSTADSAVEPGTVTVASTVVDVALSELEELPVEIPDRFAPDPCLTESLLGVPGTHEATLMCWEGHVPSPAHRPPVEAEGPETVVVDWESAAVARVAMMWGVPWAAVKVVSDHGEPERLRLLALVAKRPLQWGAEIVRRACNEYLKEPADDPRGDDGEAQQEPQKEERGG
jgi:nucleoside phosphorylase